MIDFSCGLCYNSIKVYVLKGGLSMKKVSKRLPVYIAIALVALIVAAFTVVAANFDYDFDGNGAVNNDDLIVVMESITGKDISADVSLADYNGDGKLDVRDVIAIKRIMLFRDSVEDGWTKGIY